MIPAHLVAALALALPGVAAAFTNVAVGDAVEQETMPTLDGGSAPLLSREAKANVLVFFRPRQENSTETLRAMASCESEFRDRPVRWVAIVSSSWDPKDVRQVVADTGIRMPVLVDRDDHLYGRLGVRLHPVVGVVDGAFRLVAYEPFLKVNYCDRVRARIRLALGEIDAEASRKVDAPDAATMPGDAAGAASSRRLKLGAMLLRSGQAAKAEAEARAVLEKEPRNVAALVLLGDARAAQGDCTGASKAYADALAVDPANADARRGASSCSTPR
jgi:peroxiredoxin